MTDTDTDRAAFLRAIIARPDDDLPRLVFADFLEERGEAERAEFIRVQCRKAEMAREYDPQSPLPIDHPAHAAWRTLVERERELLEGFCRDDLAPLFGLPPHETILPTLSGLIAPGPGVELLFRGGLVARVSGPLAAFWEERECQRCGGECNMSRPCGECQTTGRVSGPTPAFRELCRREPLPADGVAVTDREPWSPEQPEPGEMDYCWWRESVWAEHREIRRNALGNLPDALFDAMAGFHPAAQMSWDSGPRNQHVGFSTQAAAAAALSRALVTLARG